MGLMCAMRVTRLPQLCLSRMGLWDRPRLRAWFQRMIDAAAVQAEDEREEAAMRGRLSEEWQRRISMALQRGNARIIISRSRQARDRLGTRVGRAWGRAQDTELDFGEGQ